MDYWQVYLIAAPVIIAGLSAGLATYFLLDRVDPSADYENGVGAKRCKPRFKSRENLTGLCPGDYRASSIDQRMRPKVRRRLR